MSSKSSPSSLNPSSWTSPSQGNKLSLGRPSKGPGSKLGSSAKVNAPTTRSPPASATQSGISKRLACDNCRERKVRCNREQPRCGRCTRLGHSCKYTTPGKQQSSQVDVSKLLLMLHSRLEQTEARLAMNGPLLGANQGMNSDPIPSSVDIPSSNFLDMQQQPQQVPTQQGALPDMGYLDDLNIDEQILQSDIDTW